MNRKQFIQFLVLFFLFGFLALSGCISGISIEADFSIDQILQIDASEQIKTFAIRPLSDYDDLIYVLYKPLENSSLKADTQSSSPTGLYVIPSAIGTLFQTDAALSNVLLGSKEILLKDNLFFFIKDQTVGAVNESGILQWERDFTVQSKTPVTFGFGVNSVDEERLGVIFYNEDNRDEQSDYTCELYPFTGADSPDREIFISHIEPIENIFGPFTVFDQNYFLLKTESWLINDTDGIFVETPVPTNNSILSVGPQFDANGNEELYLLYTDGDSLTELIYNQNGELISTKQVQSDLQTGIRNDIRLGEIIANNPVNNKGNSIYMATDKGIPQIKQKNIQPPVEDRLQVEFSQTPPSVVEAENCTNGECQVQLHIKSNKQNIEYDGVYIKKEDDTDLYNSMEVSQGQSSEGEYHYTLTFSIPEGRNNIVIVFKSGWQYAGLSFQIECICPVTPPPEINWDPDKPPTDTTAEDTTKLNIQSDQILDILRIWNNTQPQVMESPVYEEDDNKFNYEATVDLEEGDNDIQVQGENENGESNTIDHIIEKGSPPEITFAENPPEQLTNCEDDECEAQLIITITNNFTELICQVGDEEPETYNTLQPDQDGNYLIYPMLKKGDNTITITAKNQFGESNTLTCTIECVCPEEETPQINWDPDKPPTDTTAEDTTKLNIQSDQILDILRIWNNTQPQVMESPVYEEDDNKFNYEATVELEEGDNDIQVQGENENGESNTIDQIIEKGSPPEIAFAENPPEQLTNCENDECVARLVFSITNTFTELTCQVGDEEPETFTDLQSDNHGNYVIYKTIQKGGNTLTIKAKNQFGESNTLTCSIECVCPETGDYMHKDTIGEETITQPVDINIYLYDATYGVLVVSQFIHDMQTLGQVYKISAQAAQALAYYTGVDGYIGLQGVACGLSDNNTLFLQKGDYIAGTNSEGAPVNTYPLCKNHQNQTGQIDRYGNQIRYLSRDAGGSGYDYLNYLYPNDQSQNKGVAITGNAGCDTVNNSGQHHGKVLMTNTNTASGSRPDSASIIVVDDTGSSEKLFDIPESDGIPMDISVISDYPDFYCLVTAQRDDGYWVNLYTEAGQKLIEFKTHDLITSQTREEQRDTAIYSAIKGEFDDYIYVINSLYPGVQVWEEGE